MAIRVSPEARDDLRDARRATTARFRPPRSAAELAERIVQDFCPALLAVAEVPPLGREHPEIPGLAGSTSGRSCTLPFYLVVCTDIVVVAVEHDASRLRGAEFSGALPVSRELWWL